MYQYGIVTLTRDCHTTIVLFPDRLAIEEYKITHASLLETFYLWYVVEILERSQSEIAAALELIAETQRKVV